MNLNLVIYVQMQIILILYIMDVFNISSLNFICIYKKLLDFLQTFKNKINSIIDKLNIYKYNKHF